MPVEVNPQFLELSATIDNNFPFSKLLVLAKDPKNLIVPLGNESLNELFRKITLNPVYKDKLLPEAGLGDKDILVARPSTRKLIEIHHGSYFYPESLSALEDEKLNQSVEFLFSQSPESRQVRRDAFAVVLEPSIVTMGTLIVPHGLTKSEVEMIVKDSLKAGIHHRGFRNNIEAITCFYAGMKIVANRLKYNIQ